VLSKTAHPVAVPAICILTAKSLCGQVSCKARALLLELLLGRRCACACVCVCVHVFVHVCVFVCVYKCVQHLKTADLRSVINAPTKNV